MFKRLQQKWNVSTKQFWIIFIVFGCTGITTAYLTKTITALLGFSNTTFWLWKLLLRLGMLLIGYQILLLLFGALFGQWKFFWKYERKLLQKLGIIKKDDRMKMTDDRAGIPIGADKVIEQRESPGNMLIKNKLRIKNIAIFASGSGTNAQKIIEHFINHRTITVGLIVCNVPGAGVIDKAANYEVPVLFINKETFFRSNDYVIVLKEKGIDFIVLAGFLWKVPENLIAAYPGKIINIHPALLPKYGGKGMYGLKVHQAVIEAGEKESGITIHYVDEHYDNGEVILQARCSVYTSDTAETLAERVHKLEHEHYAVVIENLLAKD